MKISVITAAYNSEATIVSAVESVQSQTCDAIEHVIIDGKSTDGTLALLSKCIDGRTVLVSESDEGIYDALNKGIRHSTGDVIGFLHADDVYAGPDVLSHVAAIFEDASVSAVYGDLQYVRKEDTAQVVRHWQSSPFRRGQLDWGWMPPHPTLYVRREWYERIGGFDTRYRIAADYFSILQMFSHPEFKAVYLPEVLVKMRLGGASNRSLRNIIQKSREDFDALRRAKVGALGGFGALAWKNLSKLTQFRG